jgi:hypothetical protein
LASYIDGVNLSAHGVGDVFEVTRHEAELLIAEEWAVPVVPRAHPLRSRTAATLSQVKREDGRPGPMAAQLRDIGEQIDRRSFHPQDHRRADDLIRDAWHDEHARILNASDSAH